MENVRHMNPHDSADTDGLTRTPPQDLEAEQSVLGGMFFSRDAIHQAARVLKDGTEFYRPAHETIYRAILDVDAAGDAADPITVAAHLQRTGQLQRVGGASYLHTLAHTVPSVANVDTYAEIVREKAVLRRIVEAGTRILQLGHTGGDLDDIVTATRKEIESATEAHTTGEPGHLVNALIDWNPFFATDFGNIQLLPGRLMAPGQQITLVGDGKAGKSLFAQEWCWRMATGRPFLDDTPQDPVSILYLDAENGIETVQERFLSFGAGPGRMGLLSYASFPPIRPLDTAGGGADVIALATAVEARIVVIDTVSRFISGPENDADTWLALYRHTLMPLKAAGLASIRLDHLGKDTERGARGSSAKTQDVDHVWELRAQGGGTLLLKRTHTRTGLGPDSFALLRQARKDGEHWAAGGTRHIIATPDPVGFGAGTGTGLAAIPGTVEHIVARLDEAGVPNTWGAPRCSKKLAELGVRAGKAKLEEAIKVRKTRGVQIGTGDNEPGAQFWTDGTDLELPGHGGALNA